MNRLMVGTMIAALVGTMISTSAFAAREMEVRDASRPQKIDPPPRPLMDIRRFHVKMSGIVALLGPNGPEAPTVKVIKTKAPYIKSGQQFWIKIKVSQDLSKKVGAGQTDIKGKLSGDCVGDGSGMSIMKMMNKSFELKNLGASGEVVVGPFSYIAKPNADKPMIRDYWCELLAEIQPATSSWKFTTDSYPAQKQGLQFLPEGVPPRNM